MARRPRKRNAVILIAVMMSIILYSAGVLSGLYANKVLDAKTQLDIRELKDETQADIQAVQAGTEEDIKALRSYLTFLEATLKSMQLEQVFVQSLSREEACAFSSVSMQYLIDELQQYREQLPFRIEEYERENELTSEYLALKEQYNALSIHTWILARNHKHQCGADLVHGLYFYSRSCDTCVQQGIQLDAFTEAVQRDGQDVMLFTIDYDSDDPIISIVKQYFSITATPAVIINDVVYQGLISSAWLVEGAI